MSSAEAELVASNKAAAEILGMLSMLADWGEQSKRKPVSYGGNGSPSAGAARVEPEPSGLTGVVCGDSSAAIAVSQRRGCGKLRHINIGELWIQEKVVEGELEVRKVDGVKNPADLLTKHVNEAKCDFYCHAMSMEWCGGRSQMGLKVQHGGGGGEAKAV